MVKIQGVDPILMERIREKNRTTVYESNQTRQVVQKQPKEKHESGQRQGKSKKKLEFAIARLNQLLTELSAPICFVIILKEDNVMVQVVDVTTDKVLSVISPEKVYQLLNNIDDPKGFVVDDSV